MRKVNVSLIIKELAEFQNQTENQTFILDI